MQKWNTFRFPSQRAPAPCSPHGPARNRGSPVHGRSPHRVPPPVLRRAGNSPRFSPASAFVDAFANSAAVDTDDGLVVVDTSGIFQAKSVHETMRRWSGSRLDTAIFTHGHIDHVFGVELYEAEARDERVGAAAGRRARARAGALRSLQAHRGLQRGDQPAAVQGARAALAARLPLPGRDVPRRDLDARSRRRALRAAPRARRDRRRHVGVVARRARSCSRATCSSGRRRTAATRRRCSATRATGPTAFRAMAALQPEVLLPGHGLPIVGADRVRQALERRRRAAGVACSTRRSR